MADVGAIVAAVLVFGDPCHTAGQPYNIETGADKNGSFPRSGAYLEKMGTYASVLRSYCVATDPVCAGGEDHASHLDYFQKFTDDAASWVRSMVGIDDNAAATTAATTTAASSSRATSESSSAGPSATTGADVGTSSTTGTSSGLPSSTETGAGASTTATATATASVTGSGTATATPENGVAPLGGDLVLAWMGVMMGLCLVVGQ